MSAMNDLELKLREAENLIDQTKETILSLYELLSSSQNGEQCNDEQPKRNPVKDKVTVRQMLADKCKEGYTDQIKDLLQKFGADKLSDVDPKDYEDLYYSAEAIGQ